MRCSSWWPKRGEIGVEDPDLEIGAPLVEEIAGLGHPGALPALIALGEVSDGELGLLALRRARRLIAEGAPAPLWGESILEAEIHRTAVMREEVFDDGFTIFIEASHGDGERHAVGVYIDNNLGVMAKDILMADSIDRVERLLRENPREDGELRIEPIDPAAVRARIREAMALTDGRVKVLDIVELRASSGRWPRGTEGTVLELFGSEAALVEISDDLRRTLEELELPIGVLKTVSRPPQQRLPIR